MIRSLFWKLFLLFWLTQVATLSITSVRFHYVGGRSSPWWLSATRKALPVLTREAASAFEQGGRDGLRAQLERVSEPGNFQYWLLRAPEDNNLSGIDMPQQIQAALQSNKLVRNGEVSRVGEQRVLAYPVHTEKGAYLFVGAFAPPPFTVRPVNQLLPPLLAAFCVSGFCCLLIARSVTDPLSRLQNTTRALAEGDLSARFGPELGRRSDEVASLVHDFDLMADRLRELVHSHKRLLGDVSHELRSPLSRLQVALALARREETKGGVELHQRMEQELLRLNALIEQVLTLARLESKEAPARLHPVLLNELVEEVVYDASFEAEPSGGKILHSVPEAEITITGSYELLHSAVENIVRNALRYTGPRTPVKVNLGSADDCAVITVEDSGPGVPEASLAHLFEPFYRVDDARDEATGGTGLGLAIAQRAVALHRGFITAENIKPHGLRVNILIPLTAILAGGEAVR
jgi:two-component system, OmpR family, sensor histidine kinase CpxA